MTITNTATGAVVTMLEDGSNGLAAFLHAQHCSGLRVFRLEPVFHLAASIGRLDALGHDAFESQPAGVLEDATPVAGQVLAVANSWLGLPQKLTERRLPFG